MSGWDWIHAGLEIATFAQAQKAQRNLAAMRTGAEMDAARRTLLEAMKGFIFDISRDIQLAEEQITDYPQQVYIVARSLHWRLTDSGLSTDVFPDLQDKEYVFNMERKIAGVITRSKGNLTEAQIQQSDTAVQYITEMPMLQQAISAKAGQESLRDTDEGWKDVSGRQGRKNLFVGLGALGLGLTACVVCPFVGSAFSMLAMGAASGDFGALAVGVITMAIMGAIPIGAVAAFTFAGKTSAPDYVPLKTQREKWRKQLLPATEWSRVVSTFGELSSAQFSKIYEERLAFLSPILGGEFEKYLGSSE